MQLQTGSGSSRSGSTKTRKEEILWSYVTRIRWSTIETFDLRIGGWIRYPAGGLKLAWDACALTSIFAAVICNLPQGTESAVLELVAQCHSMRTETVNARYKVTISHGDNGEPAVSISPETESAGPEEEASGR